MTAQVTAPSGALWVPMGSVPNGSLWVSECPDGVPMGQSLWISMESLGVLMGFWVSLWVPMGSVPMGSVAVDPYGSP